MLTHATDKKETLESQSKNVSKTFKKSADYFFIFHFPRQILLFLINKNNSFP